MGTAHEAVTLRGFFRLQIEDPESGEIVGDSGYQKNQITNLGVLNYLVGALGSLANSSYVSFAGIGEGAEPGAADTTIANECTGTNAVPGRATLTRASSGSTGLKCTGTFGSGDSFVTAQESIQNIGLYRSTTLGTVFAGNSFAQSTIDTNQNANFTYEITFTPS
jgi:hypothetical protein